MDFHALDEFFCRSMPIGFMHSIYAYIWLNFMVNVGKYTLHILHGSHGMFFNVFANDSIFVNLEDFPVHEGNLH